MISKDKLRAELSTLTNEALYVHIETARAFTRHPYATAPDIEEYKLRIRVATEILTLRFRKELEAPGEGPPSKAPQSVQGTLGIDSGNRHPELTDAELTIRSLLLLPEEALEARLRKIALRLNHPTTRTLSEAAEKRIAEEIDNLTEALHRKRNSNR